MSRILHPTDFSPASRTAFARAVTLAKKDRSELVIAHVLAPVMPPVDGYLTAQMYADMETAGRRYGKKHRARRLSGADRARRSVRRPCV